jgi:hypothetical protein
MNFELTEDIPLAVDEVCALLRDRLPDLVPFLPSVDEIEELERGADGDDVVIVNLWRGSRAMMPALARPFVTRAMVTWKDYARWPGGAARVEWRLEPHSLASLFSCEGVNFIETSPGGGARLRITGELNLYPERIPGISPALARRLEPKLTPWIVARIKPNLSLVPQALQRFVAARDAAAQPAATS